jgi:hypothetical protein
MAASESIKTALSELSDEWVWADNLAKCFVLAGAENSPPWVMQFERTIEALGERIEALEVAINTEPVPAFRSVQ